MTLEAALTGGAQALGLSLPEEAVSAFRVYHDQLARKNAVMDLTAVSGEENIARIHFLDSLALLGICDFTGRRVIDIGSGAGFPGLPLKLAQPSVQLTLLDAQQKRVAFLSELCGLLGLRDTACIHARAEEYAAAGKPERESFDLAVSRAVAPLRFLAELCLPFVRPGGAMIAMKSAGCDGEVSDARRAVALLGGGDIALHAYTVPGADIPRRAVVVRKAEPTPGIYPRRFAKIQRSPL